MIGGGGAGKTRADDDVLEVSRDTHGELKFYLKSEAIPKGSAEIPYLAFDRNPNCDIVNDKCAFIATRNGTAPKRYNFRPPTTCSISCPTTCSKKKGLGAPSGTSCGAALPPR